jgi:kynurenine formamidase
MSPLNLLRQHQWIDLSVPISPEHPGEWPGNLPMTVKRLGWYDQKDPYFNRLLTMEEHTGTHIDAPPHFIPAPELDFPRAAPSGRQTVEQIPLESLVKAACVIDASDLIGKAENGISPRFTKARMLEWEAEHGKLSADDAVLLRTGWTDRFYKPGQEGKRHGEAPVIQKSVPAWPAPDEESLQLMIDRGVRLFGTDCPSAGLLDRIVECHYLALGAGLLFVENLTNLAILPPRSALFVFLPLKIVGGSGSPGRAMAIVPKTERTGGER